MIGNDLIAPWPAFRGIMRVLPLCWFVVLAALCCTAGSSARLIGDPSQVNLNVHRQLRVQHTRHPHGGCDPTPFYATPEMSLFRTLATSMKVVTDKVTAHQYESMYSKYFEMQHHRLQKLKLLEIGLGCDMHYEPGASAHLWRKYLPAAEIWFAEYNQSCVAMHNDALTAIGIAGVLVGDQSNMTVLASWVEQSHGSFDVIIDDGGHQNHQIYNSFQHLFTHALKPGGIYFIEDLQAQQFNEFRGTGPIMQAVLSDWMQGLMQRHHVAPLDELAKSEQASQRTVPSHFGGLAKDAYVPKTRLPVGIKFMDCMGEICAIIKCTSDDKHCPASFP